MLMWSSPLAKQLNVIGSFLRVDIFLEAVSNRAGSGEYISIQKNDNFYLILTVKNHKQNHKKIIKWKSKKKWQINNNKWYENNNRSFIINLEIKLN